MALFFDDLTCSDDISLSPIQNNSNNEDDVKESIVNILCNNKENTQVPIILRIRKLITESPEVAKTRSYINIELDNELINNLEILDNYIRTSVYKHHSSPYLFNNEFPETVITERYTSCIMSDESNNKWLRVRTDFQTKTQTPQITMYEDINDEEVASTVTSLDNYQNRVGEYIICLTAIRFLKSSFKCDFVLRAIDCESNNNHSSESPSLSLESINLAELIMRNNKKVEANVEENGEKTRPEQEQEQEQVQVQVQEPVQVQEQEQEQEPVQVQVQVQEQEPVQVQAQAQVEEEQELKHTRTRKKKISKKLTAHHEMVLRQQHYINKLKDMQETIQHDVEIALQKKQTIDTDYTDAVESLTVLQENSVRSGDGYTTDDEMIRQDAEEALQNS